ncbi:MAG TPA: ABC transporter permease [Candidatus Acidoferrum sp.]|jgi:ABC-2 type transport system permease protein|nr:ABC transporter permease [Candidatus Acidoferrum sp.]
MYGQSVVPRADWADLQRAPAWWRLVISRVITFCWVEVAKIRHDRTELYTRAIQPALWLVIFGETFSAIRAIPSGGKPYLDFMAPGIIAQSALFVAIFYGIQIIWERDAGVLTKLLATPTPASALVAGKAFGASVRSLLQAAVVVVLATLLGVHMTRDPLNYVVVIVVVVLGAAFFSTLSLTIAGIVLNRDRLMGISQAITMPLFFASNALYPIAIMPGWLQVLSAINPLRYEIDALRGLLIGTPSNLPEDFGVLLIACVLGIATSSRLLRRLSQ